MVEVGVALTVSVVLESRNFFFGMNCSGGIGKGSGRGVGKYLYHAIIHAESCGGTKGVVTQKYKVT